jgi:hypothetical protein
MCKRATAMFGGAFSRPLQKVEIDQHRNPTKLPHHELHVTLAQKGMQDLEIGQKNIGGSIRFCFARQFRVLASFLCKPPSQKIYLKLKIFGCRSFPIGCVELDCPEEGPSA